MPNIMKKATTLFFAFILFLITVFSYGEFASAASYTQAYSEVFGLNSVLPSGNARSPVRISGADEWARVNSKNNQPRSSGTNPHKGTDLQKAAGQPVYPILKGKVVAVNHDTSCQLGSVTLNHDIDGNGTFDGYYVRYLHIDPTGDKDNGVKKGDVFDVTDSFGTVDIDRRPGCANGFPAHLHFHRVSSETATVTLKLYNFYRTVSAWNNGSHLDFISGDAYVGNELYITAYSCTDYGTVSTGCYSPTSVDLYYKIGSSGTWQKSTTSFSLFNASIYRYYINLKTATGATTGQTVYYYVAAIRQNDPTWSGSYKHAIFPQYYEQPALPLPVSPTNYPNTIARSFTVS